MNGVESAASLFGSDEPTADPFAALGADGTTSQPTTASDDLFATHEPHDFLAAAPTQSDLFSRAADTVHDTFQQVQPDQAGHENDNSASHHVLADAGSVGRDQDQDGQWPSYEQPVVASSHITEVGYQQEPQATATAVQDAYAPEATYAASIQNTAHSQPSNYLPPPTYPSSAYSQPDVYARPSTFSQPTTYTQNSTYSQPTAYSQSAYDPYAPRSQGHNSQSTTTLSSFSTPNVYKPSTQPTAAVQHNYTYPAVNPASRDVGISPPPPLRPAALPVTTAQTPPSALNRPKVTNAYDPPFPSTISSRRPAPSRTNAGHGSYSSYQSPNAVPPSSSIPPPPRTDVATPPHAPSSMNHGYEYSYPTPAIPSSVKEQQRGPGHLASNQYAHVPYAPNYSPQSEDTTEKRSSMGQFHPSNQNTGPVQERKQYTSQQMVNENAEATFDDGIPSQESQPANGTSEIKHAFSHVPVNADGVNIEQGLEALTPLPASPVDTFSTYTSSPTSSLPSESPRLSQDHPPSASRSRPSSRVSHVPPVSHIRHDLPEPTDQQAPVPRDMNSSPRPIYANGTHNLAHPARSRPSSPQNSFDPYAPRGSRVSNVYGGERSGSPSSSSLKSSSGRHSTKPYSSVPAKAPAGELSPKHSTSGSFEDPYAPAHPGNATMTREPEHTTHASPYIQSAGPVYSNSLVQEVIMKQSSALYAPSPSLIGANDPLGRTATRAPVLSFSFGGKLVTCFHGSASLNTGFDVALSSRNTTAISIRILKNIIPESALDIPSTSYPGPLLSDPGAPAAGLVRTGTATLVKTKKANVAKYLEERADEISRGLGYIAAGSTEKRGMEGKLVLVKLLKLMVEHDGRLSGSPQIDAAVRTALVPRLDIPTTGVSDTAVPAYAIPSDGQSGISDISYGAMSAARDTAISVTSLYPSALDKIEDFLLRGERQKAYHFALDEKLWAHAMVIASSIDKEAWKEVVNEFLKNELGGKLPVGNAGTLRGTDSQTHVENGRETLRVAYSLFSGQGSAAVQELVPQNFLARPSGRKQPGVVSHMTPRTPNFGAAVPTVIPVESLSKWSETVAMMISSPLTPETSAALTALGDQLLANNWVEAAHACYLLSPQTCPLGGLGNLSSRMVLVGSKSPAVYPRFAKDADALIFSEIVEFALSLTPVAKGQDAFTGLPHLQPYRFIRAMALAELGDMQLAGRYCEAITSSLVRGSPNYTTILLEQLKGLSDRINGVSHGDRSGSWMGGKLAKPSLDTIGGWLEGRFTKLVTGDADTPTTTEAEKPSTEDRTFAGPFAHYSTISTTPSARSSPQPTTVNLNVLPPPRAGSAMSNSSYVPNQINRPASAIDQGRRRPSPAPYASSAGAAATTFAHTSQYGINTYSSMNGYAPDEDLMTPKASNDEKEDDNVQEATWWGASSYADTSSTRTPTTATFMSVDSDNVASSSDGFISLMDNHSLSVEPQSYSQRDSQPSSSLMDDDDLGIGNSKPRREKVQQEQHKEEGTSSETVAPSKPAAPVRPELKPAAASSGSWLSLSRLWKRAEPTTPGPIKASLGEESAFYYDKELKRWVNKKAGTEEAPKPSAPPPPPSRAQTASPGMSGGRPLPPMSNGANPPRSASAIDLSTSPPSNKPVMRIRSNLVPVPDSAPSTPTGTRLTSPGPPPSRPRSQASGKRNVRSRYVDVLSQEQNAG